MHGRRQVLVALAGVDLGAQLRPRFAARARAARTPTRAATRSSRGRRRARSSARRGAPSATSPSHPRAGPRAASRACRRGRRRRRPGARSISAKIRLVGPLGDALELSDGAPPAELLARLGITDSGFSANASTSVSASRSSSSCGALVEPEHGAEDDLERQVLEPRVEGHRLLASASRRARARSARSSARRAAASSRRGRPAAAACAARGGSSSSSRITECLPTTGSRIRAPSPGWIASGGGGQQLLDVRRIGQDHERRLERKLNRDRLPYLCVGPVKRRRRAGPGGGHLQERGPGGPGGSWSLSMRAAILDLPRPC